MTETLREREMGVCCKKKRDTRCILSHASGSKDNWKRSLGINEVKQKSVGVKHVKTESNIN